MSADDAARRMERRMERGVLVVRRGVVSLRRRLGERLAVFDVVGLGIKKDTDEERRKNGVNTWKLGRSLIVGVGSRLCGGFGGGCCAGGRAAVGVGRGWR